MMERRGEGVIKEGGGGGEKQKVQMKYKVLK